LLQLLLLLLLCCTANLSAQRTFVCSIVCVISISHRTEIVVHVPNNNNRPRLLKNKRLLSKVHFCCYSLCINRKMFTAENEKYKKKSPFWKDLNRMPFSQRIETFCSGISISSFPCRRYEDKILSTNVSNSSTQKRLKNNNKRRKRI